MAGKRRAVLHRDLAEGGACQSCKNSREFLCQACVDIALGKATGVPVCSCYMTSEQPRAGHTLTTWAAVAAKGTAHPIVQESKGHRIRT